MVKRLLVVAIVLFTGLALKSVSAQSKATPYVHPVSAVKFTPLDPKDPGGAAISVITGELQGKGPITLLLRLAKGAAPIHTHTSNYYAVLVKGQSKHWPAGADASKAETLNPGSVWYQPGKAPHGDECLTAQCVLVLQMDGPYDFIPVTK